MLCTRYLLLSLEKPKLFEYITGGKMRTDTIIRFEGMKALREKLDIVEAEKFISLILREDFDYTEWQRDIWNDKTVDEIFYAAKTYSENQRR